MSKNKASETHDRCVCEECPRCGSDRIVAISVYVALYRMDTEMDYLCADCRDRDRDPFFTVSCDYLPRRIFDRQHRIEWIDGKPVTLVEK